MCVGGGGDAPLGSATIPDGIEKINPIFFPRNLDNDSFLR